MDNYMVIPLDEEKANAIFALRAGDMLNFITDPSREPYRTLILLEVLEIAGAGNILPPTLWVVPLTIRDYGRECKVYHTEHGWELWAPITISK